jgi:hypothetical protein
MGMNAQVILFPDESGNRKPPRKCQSQTLACLSTIASGAFSGSIALKF